MANPDSESFVRSFARGLGVIEVLGREARPLTLAEVAEGVGLPRTAVRRFLFTLIDLSFVDTDGKHYWLTPRVLRLGLSYLQSLPYWRHAQLALEELCARVRQSCALSVLDGEDIVYLLRQHTKRILPVSPTLGSRLPAHAVSMGRVLLATIRRRARRLSRERDAQAADRGHAGRPRAPAAPDPAGTRSGLRVDRRRARRVDLRPRGAGARRRRAHRRGDQREPAQRRVRSRRGGATVPGAAAPGGVAAARVDDLIGAGRAPRREGRGPSRAAGSLSARRRAVAIGLRPTCRSGPAWPAASRACRAPIRG